MYWATVCRTHLTQRNGLCCCFYSHSDRWIQCISQLTYIFVLMKITFHKTFRQEFLLDLCVWPQQHGWLKQISCSTLFSYHFFPISPGTSPSTHHWRDWSISELMCRYPANFVPETGNFICKCKSTLKIQQHILWNRHSLLLVKDITPF